MAKLDYKTKDAKRREMLAAAAVINSHTLPVTPIKIFCIDHAIFQTDFQDSQMKDKQRQFF